MPQQITLDQLIALNEEIAGLARAGVPLDQGLLHLGRDLPGRLGAISRRLGQRLEAGEPLTRVLEDEPDLPPAYRAVVAAGIRTGRLAVALEGITTLVRRSSEMRRTIAVSLIYPVVVLTIAYNLFTFLLAKIFPVMSVGFRHFAPQGGAGQFIERLEASAPYWLPWLPPLLLVALVVAWFRSQRATSIEASSGRGARDTLLGGRPSFGSVLHADRVALFSDTLALLLQQDVPLPEALVLAADSSADRRLRESCRRLAEQIERGVPSPPTPLPGVPGRGEVSEATPVAGRLGRGEIGETPPLPGVPGRGEGESASGWELMGELPVLGWLLTGVQDQTRLIASLRRAAASYRRHADWALRWLSFYLPLWLTVGVGGTAVLLYAVSVFAPWCRTLYDMSLP